MSNRTLLAQAWKSRPLGDQFVKTTTSPKTKQLLRLASY
jgi:hypothetical protein